MEVGGAEKALLGLLETIDKTKYNVDLFLMRHEGELLKYIPKGITLLNEKIEYSSLAVPITKVLKKKELRVAFGRLCGKIKAQKRVRELKLSEDNDVALEYSHKYTLFAMPMISEKEYDFAISFLTPHYFVAERVVAKKKIAWIHTDYSVVEVDKKSQFEMWDKYDMIASISEQVTISFLQQFPDLKNKVQLIENIIPTKYMKRMAEKLISKNEMPIGENIILLSIGRYCMAKNFDNIPNICKLLRDKGLPIKWYIIGYGGKEKLIKEKIVEEEMQEYVVLLGKKENPYPYIKKCDIYIQPSRYEGKCVSVIEAQILNKPVVITNYATSESQLKDGVDGIIVPMDNNGCAQGIYQVIINKKLQEKLIDNTKRKDYSNAKEIEKIYRLIEK